MRCMQKAEAEEAEAKQAEEAWEKNVTPKFVFFFFFKLRKNIFLQKSVFQFF